MVFTAALKRSQWPVVLVLLWFVKHSTQQETVTIQDLKTVMLLRFDVIDEKLVKIEEQLTKLWDINDKQFNNDNGIHDYYVDTFEIVNNLTQERIEIVNKIDILGIQLNQSMTVLKDSFLVKDNSTMVSTDIIARLDSMKNQLNESITLLHKPIDGINNQLDALDKTLNNSVMMMSNAYDKEQALLTINPFDISLFEGQELVMDCGIVGSFLSCHWQHDGNIYQIADVANDHYSNIQSASKRNSNQCGIIVSHANSSHGGNWTCHVLTSEQNYTTSKKITIEKISLLFDQRNASQHVGVEVELTCGIEGVFNSCQWEHGGQVYQVADIINGNYSTLRATNRRTSNQCGIVINSFKMADNGVWSCKVVTPGKLLSGSKSVGCREGFFMPKGSKKCFKVFNDTTRNANQAKTKCVDEGLKKARPSDAVAVALRKAIVDNYGSSVNVWLDGRGDGSSFRWQTDWSKLGSDNSLWYSGEPGREISSEYCLVMLSNQSNMNSYPEQPYQSDKCSSGGKYTLCEEV